MNRIKKDHAGLLDRWLAMKPCCMCIAWPTCGGTCDECFTEGGKYKPSSVAEALRALLDEREKWRKELVQIYRGFSASSYTGFEARKRVLARIAELEAEAEEESK